MEEGNQLLNVAKVFFLYMKHEWSPAQVLLVSIQDKRVNIYSQS